jgi:hypothetical protein
MTARTIAIADVVPWDANVGVRHNGKPRSQISDLVYL